MSLVRKSIWTIIGLFFVSTIWALAVEIKEAKLTLGSASSMKFTLIKTMALTGESKMTGRATNITGTIDMTGKTLSISMPINEKSFQLDGEYKFANSRMHEEYLESSQYGTASYEGTILSYDSATGSAKVKGKMTIHGTTKDNFELTGRVTPAKTEGYRLECDFKVNLNDFNVKTPDIKLAKVSNIVTLNAAFHLKEAK